VLLLLCSGGDDCFDDLDDLDSDCAGGGGLSGDRKEEDDDVECRTIVVSRSRAAIHGRTFRKCLCLLFIRWWGAADIHALDWCKCNINSKTAAFDDLFVGEEATMVYVP
jgi:hypothetical protein